MQLPLYANPRGLNLNQFIEDLKRINKLKGFKKNGS